MPTIPDITDSVDNTDPVPPVITMGFPAVFLTR